MRNLYRSPKVIVAGALALGMLVSGGTAKASCPTQSPEVSNDLSVECLIAPRKPVSGQSYDPTLYEQSMYRSLLSELTAVMAVPALDPADTVGYSGFHFTFDVATTSIKKDAPYWGGFAQPDGTKTQAGVRHVSGGFLPVASLMIRKGIWPLMLPIGFELGFGGSNLLQSGIYALNGYAKIALHEGYHDIPVPSIAARATVSRLAGTPQVDMTILTAEGLMSKAFGIGGTFTMEPYIGGGAIWSIVRSQVVDTAPNIDLYRGQPPGMTTVSAADSLAQKVVFPTQDDIFRWRVFGGINFHYAIISVTLSYAFVGAGADNGFDKNGDGNFGPSDFPTKIGAAPSGSAAACRSDASDGSKVCPKDVSGAQHTIGAGIGLRF
ncbi:MAG TPA: hypothetical protein PKL17_09365 [Pseudomonadota bacterium]|jgi:hypothetical protein|nr:hypothetical protein [Pseudomonadota bacterium]HNN50286.1 hypothetical protein [Pseudomonadota bacterium]